MSSFIRARRDDERGANRIEPTGAGSVEGTPPSRAGLSDPGGSGPAGAGERTPPAASAETGAGGGGQGRSASAAGAAPSNRKIPAALQGRILAQVRRRYADFGPTLAKRAPGARWVAGQPGDAAAVDDRRRAVAVAPAAEASGARLARAAGRLRRVGDDGQLALSLVGAARTSRAVDRADRRRYQPGLGPLRRPGLDRGKPAHPGRLAPALGTAAGTLYRQKQPVPHHPLGPARRAARRSAGPHPDRAGPAGVGDRVDSRPQPPGQGAHRETIRHLAGPPGQGDAPGRGAHGGAGQPLPGSSLPAFLGAALHRRSAPAARCPPPAGRHPAAGVNPERARTAPGGRRLHRALAGPALGDPARPGASGVAGGAGGGRTAARRQPLGPLPRLLSQPAALPAPATPFGLRPTGLVGPRKGKRKYIPPPDHPWRRTFLSGKKPDISTLR